MDGADRAPVIVAVDDTPPQPTSLSVAPPPPPDVRILSVPRTVELLVDGTDVGRTPKKLPLDPGPYTITVRSGDREARFDIRVARGAENTWCYSFAEGAAVPGKCR